MMKCFLFCILSALLFTSCNVIRAITDDDLEIPQAFAVGRDLRALIQDTSWETNCVSTGETFDFVSKVQFTNYNYTATITYYLAGTSCANGALLKDVRHADSSISSSKLILNSKLRDFTVLNASLIPSLNASNHCGFNSWVVDIPKSVLGQNCMNEVRALNEEYHFIPEIIDDNNVVINGRHYHRK